jgi:hypothetical protein
MCYIYKTTLSAMQMWPCKGGLSWERQFCTISTISQHLKSHTGLVRDMSFGKSVSGLIRDMLFGKSVSGLIRDMSFGKSVSGLIRDMSFGRSEWPYKRYVLW